MCFHSVILLFLEHYVHRNGPELTVHAPPLIFGRDHPGHFFCLFFAKKKQALAVSSGSLLEASFPVEEDEQERDKV